MNKSAAILFEDFGPYHVARIQALDVALRELGWTLTSLRMSEKSATYAWDPPEIPADQLVITLAASYPSGIKDAFVLSWRFVKIIRRQKVSVVFLPSYAPLPNALCLVNAWFAGCKCIMLNESWEATEKTGRIGRIIKKLLIKLFSAAVVGGSRHKDYAIRYGIPASRVFACYDVVDVNYFETRVQKTNGISSLKLPERYFLNIGRFVPKKNLGVLISAYAMLIKDRPELEISLVLVGDGNCLNQLQTLALESGVAWRDGLDLESLNCGPGIFHYPFQQIDSLPSIYAGCEAFILPSILEEWGSVVNEAMSSGSAVVVSAMAGCAPDLVHEGDNGFQFDPSDSHALTAILKRFADDPDLSQRLGSRGNKIIQDWTPQRFASSGVKALHVCLNQE